MVFVPAHRPRRELAEHQPALVSVLRIIHVDHGHVLTLVDMRA
jgi:hypothetical protein